MSHQVRTFPSTSLVLSAALPAPRTGIARAGLLVGLLLAFLAAALLVAAPAPAAGYTVVSGSTALRISPTTLQPIEKEGLILYPYGAASMSLDPASITIHEPVTGGTWNTTTQAGTLHHGGGMTWVVPSTGSNWQIIDWSQLSVTLGKAPYTMALFNGSAQQQVFGVTGTVVQKTYLKNGHRYVRITGVALPFEAIAVTELKILFPSLPVVAGQDFVTTMTTVVRVR